jgi:alkanesulfonate monooxygenase SsuD/methylene tetrahydromethanopterin reductase-like flavin-dependent oxidoreductase (luciferase family)
MPDRAERRRFGVLTFGVGPYEAIEREWRWAEEVGFDGAWIPDAFTIRGLSELEQWSILGALARATSRLRVGTLITWLFARHPTLVAFAALTLDRISDGRFELGLGAGDQPGDLRAFGQDDVPPRERVDRLAEQVALLDQMLRGGVVERASETYGRIAVTLAEPVQRPRPPIVVAAEGPRALGVAARQADAWCTLGGLFAPGGPPPSEADALAATHDRVRRLEDECRRAGREPGAVRRMVLAYRRPVDPLSSLDAFDEFVGAYADAGIDEFVFYWPPVAVLRERAEVPPERRAAAERIAAERFGRR